MLELTIAKNELLPRLLIVSGAVDKRQSLAILSNILLGFADNQLKLSATDLEIEISAQAPCESQSDNSEVTVSAKKLIDIIKSLDDQVAPCLTLKDNTLTIKSGRSHFKLATLPAEQFPTAVYEAAELQFSVRKDRLVHLFQMTHFAMSQQDVRVFLNGLLLEFENNSMTAVATDGHRMAICKVDSETTLGSHRFLIPRKSIQEMLRLLNCIADEQIQVVAGKNYFRLITTDYEFTTKLIEARFPPYHKAIPKDNDKFVLIDKETLKKALSRILILAHEKSRAVMLHIHSEGVTLIANNQEQEEAIESLEAQVDGNELKIGINASYLLDVLAILPEAVVRLSLSETDKSMLVETLNNDYQYILMPMKL